MKKSKLGGNMKHKVIALSGYSGSGKTTVCKYIKENSDYIQIIIDEYGLGAA